MQNFAQTNKRQQADKVCIYVVSSDFFQRAQSRATVLNSYNCLFTLLLTTGDEKYQLDTNK